MSAISPSSSRLREAVPDLALTTDLIVGFPGETEAEFEETVSLVEETRFDAAFTFVFSPRRGTEAATMHDQVSEEVKRERIERLIEIVQSSRQRNRTARARSGESKRCSSRARAVPTPAPARPNATKHDGQLLRLGAGPAISSTS